MEKGSNILDLVTEQTLANSKSTDHVFTASTEQAKGVDQIHSSVKVLNEAIHRIADISKQTLLLELDFKQKAKV